MRRHCVGCLLFSFAAAFPIAQPRGQGAVVEFEGDLILEATAVAVPGAAPANELGHPQSPLVPSISPFDPLGIAAAQDNAVDDETLHHQVGSTGHPTIRLFPGVQSGGEHMLVLTGDLPKTKESRVETSSLVGGSSMTAAPAELTLELSDLMLISSLSAPDLSVNGAPSDGLTLVKGESVLAVSAHQRSPASLDLGFDPELHGVDNEQAKTAIAIAAAQARGAAARQLQAVQVVNAAPRRKRVYRLADSETMLVTRDGTQHTIGQDAVEDARRIVPGASFARAFAGDTLEKLAAMHDVPVKRVRLLNRSRQRQALNDREIFCLGWKYHVRGNDTLASIARAYGSMASVIATLNGLETDADLKPGEVIQVPGEFRYQAGRNGGKGYLHITVYEQPNPRRDTPFDPQSQKTDIYTVGKGDDLESIAQDKGVTPEFLRVMNGLGEGDELRPSRRLLIKYTVRPNDDATLDDIVAAFRVDEDDLLAANNLKKAEEMKAGEPLEIPLGMQMGLDAASAVNESDRIYEVVLGETIASQAVTDDAIGEKTDGGANRIDKSP